MTRTHSKERVGLPFQQEKIMELLKEPCVYPEKPRHVEVVETHMSKVFLTDHFAYKVRKAVRYGLFDFTTMEARFHDAIEEIRSNRRFAKDLYTGVVPVNYSPDSQVRVEGEGSVIEWMVKMRRLPADGMMDYKIKKETLTDQDVRKVGRSLAIFYKRSQPSITDGDSYIVALRREIQLNYDDLLHRDYGFLSGLVETLYKAQLAFLRNKPQIFVQRAAEGRIVDCHGDLRPEHICIEANKEPVIFDCLQSYLKNRIMDAADELSFLAMECERIGAPEVGPLILETYQRITNDEPSAELLSFYKAFRACLWARLAIWRTQELKRSEWAKWICRANEYLELAKKYQPSLV